LVQFSDGCRVERRKIGPEWRRKDQRQVKFSIKQKTPEVKSASLSKCLHTSGSGEEVIDNIHKSHREPRKTLSSDESNHFEAGRVMVRRFVIHNYAKRGAQLRPIWCD
jgi:hypothetical protein